MDENGHNPTENGVTAIRVAQKITVECNPVTMQIKIDMDCPSIDLALSLLERAKRELESRYRFMRAQELQREALENNRLAAIAGHVARGGQRQA